MKFSELIYQHLSLNEMQEVYASLSKQLKTAKDIHEGLKLIDEWMQFKKKLMSMQNLCELRYKKDLSDVKMNQEIAYWHEVSPILDDLDQQWMNELSQVTWLNELNRFLPLTFWTGFDMKSKCSHKEVIPLIQEENRLVSVYLKLVGQITVEFQGQSLNLSALGAYQNDERSECRKAAWQARANAFETIEEEIDELYDQLIHLRHEMAKILGFSSFTKMGYLRLMRSDYDEQDVERLRTAILEDVTPRASLHIKDRVKANSDCSLIDEKMSQHEQNFSYDDIIAMGKTLFQRLHASDFYDIMIHDEYVDLKSRKHKEGGGYCSYLPNEAMPFVFTNFNQTINDYTVFTHEFGHAYQKVQSRDLKVFECQAPTFELAEIHSMTMEILGYDAIENETIRNRYKTKHLRESIEFLPYAALIDAFEHEMYAHPELSKKERKHVFKELEKAYLPHRTYGDIPYFERGNWWQQQGHIFFMPFYYMGYAMARITSLQFYELYLKDPTQALDNYQTLCQIGGYESFLNALKSANLTSPFEIETFTQLMKDMNY